MSDIKVTKNHAHGKEEAKKRIERMLGKMSDGMGIKTEWDGDVCRFTGPAKGEVKVGDDCVDVEVKLGLAAKMMKGTIEKKLAEGLDKALS